MKRIIQRRLVVVIPAAAAAFLVPAAGAVAAPFTVDPNPITLSAAPGESAHRQIIITNNTGRQVDINLIVLPGGEAFTTSSDKACSHVQPNGRCDVTVFYTATHQAEDHGTLRVGGPAAGGANIEVPLIGNRGAPADTTPPSRCTLAGKRHLKLIELVRRHRGRRTVLVTQRNPLNIGVTSSEAGTVSALAAGKDSKNKPIFMKVKSGPATAGHGVVLGLRMDRISEGRVLADVRRNLPSKMTLTANCIDRAGNARQAHAVVHFADSKVGRPFALPLLEDLTAR
jgi:hypothetical protein